MVDPCGKQTVGALDSPSVGEFSTPVSYGLSNGFLVPHSCCFAALPGKCSATGFTVFLEYDRFLPSGESLGPNDRDLMGTDLSVSFCRPS